MPTAAGSHGSNGDSAPAPPPKPALDRVLDALLSDRGHSLVSVVVSLGARNLVTAYCDARHRLSAADDAAAAAARAAAAGPGGELQPAPQPAPDLTNRLLDFLASPRGQQVAVLAVTAFVTGGMRAYLDQTIDINFYEVGRGQQERGQQGRGLQQAGAVAAGSVTHPKQGSRGGAGTRACKRSPGLGMRYRLRHNTWRVLDTQSRRSAAWYQSWHAPHAGFFFKPCAPPSRPPCLPAPSRRSCSVPWPSRSTWRR